MSPERFPLVVFGGDGGKDKTTTKRYKGQALPAGEGEKKVSHDDVIDPHDSMCMQNPYDLRCIVGVRMWMDQMGG
jgi:hypothetical protein